MAYKVRVTLRAYDQIDSIVAYIARDSPLAARRWRDQLLSDIATLEHFPLRHGLAPEAQALGLPLHQMMHGKYRVLYSVGDDTVIVLGIRHGARQSLRPGELTPDQ